MRVKWVICLVNEMVSLCCILGILLGLKSALKNVVLVDISFRVLDTLIICKTLLQMFRLYINGFTRYPNFHISGLLS